MYEEAKASVDMSHSSGMFSVTMNDGSGTRTSLSISDSGGSPGPLNIDRVFSNHGSFTFDASTCASGNSYAPNPSDGRNLVVLFKDETMSTWEPIPAQKINFVPFAFESKQVQGFTADSLLRVVNGNGDPLTGLSPLSNTQYTELLALVNGTTTQYSKSGQLGGVAIPLTSSLTGGQVLSWNGSAWAATSVVGGAGSVTSTMLASGAVGSSAIGSGAVGTSAIANNVTINTSGSLGARDIKIYAAGSGTGFVEMQANASIADGSSYLLKWPATAGSANQVLTTDGFGILSWAAPTVSSQWTTHGSSVSYDGTGNVGIGTTSPSSKFSVYDSAIDTSLTSSLLKQTLTYTANGAASSYATSIQTSPFVASGKTETGYVTSINSQAFRNNGASGDSGSLSNLKAAEFDYGHLNADSSATPYTATAYGLHLQPVVQSGTINTLYDLYIANTAGVGTVNSHYGIFQVGAAVNSFSGNVGIGTTAPTQALTVAGTIQSRSGGIMFPDGTLQTSASVAGSGGGGTTWQMIYAEDLATDSSSFTFSGLNGDADLEYRIVTRVLGKSNSNILLQPNGDSSANYSSSNAHSYTGGVYATTQSNESGMLIGVSDTSGTVLMSETLLYAKSGQMRTALSDFSESNGTTPMGRFSATSTWQDSASAITSLKVTSVTSGALGAGSHFEIWAKRAWAGNSQWLTASSAIHFDTGSVGIGMAAPSAVLQLKAGTAAASSAPLKFTAGTLLTTPEDGAMEYTSTGLYYTIGSTRYVIPTNTAAGNYSNVSTISNSAGGISLSPMGSNAVVINSTATSTSPTTGGILVTGGAGVTGAINASSNITSGGFLIATTNVIAPQVYGSQSPSGNIRIDGTSDTSKGNVLLASAGGNVGIGTTSPGAALQVTGAFPQAIIQSSAGTTGLRIGGQSDQTAVVEIYRSTNSVTAASPTDFERLSFGSNQYAASGSEAFIGTEKAGAGLNRALLLSMGGSEIMRLHTNGNVGIGTTAPAQMLSVAGTIESTAGGIKFPDGTTQATAATGSWTDYVPTVSSSSGTFGGLIVNSARFSRVGNTVNFSITVTITSVGSASGTVNVSLPTMPTNSYAYPAGRDIGSSGTMLVGVIIPGNQTMAVSSYNNGSTVHAGWVLSLSGTYESQ